MSIQLRKSAAIVLAAGKGTRMHSSLPKVLHPVGGLPMIGHVLHTAQSLSPESIQVVVGHQAEKVEAYLPVGINTVSQEQQLGTGHAVAQVKPALAQDTYDDIYILYGDTPLLRPHILAQMQQQRVVGAEVVVLGFEADVPGAYGRLILGEGGILEAIVEEKEATEAQKSIHTCNSGVMCVSGALLFQLVDKIGNDNAKGEYYLTDIVALARAMQKQCKVVLCDEDDVLGVNSRGELATAERVFQNRKRREALEKGVTMIAPETVYFAYDTNIAADVYIEPNVFFGPGVQVATGCVIKAFSHLEKCTLAAGVTIGPFARLRPGTHLEEGARIGNFVEIKNTHVGPDAKINHLSYIGDATVGAQANIGAGTITCNYDGQRKHKTTIAEGAFIGSNAALVAPVTVGQGSYVGSGSVITQDVPENSLAIARERQVTKVGRAAEIRARLQQITAE